MENREDEEVTHLQRHAMFFDRNKDGLIYPSETFEGCRAIGLGVVVSSLAAVFVNLLLSPKTRPGKPFSFSFPIEIKNIKFAKHTSDSGVFDKDGRFDEQKFDAIFATHALTHPNALTRKEVGALMKANRQPRDFGGWLGAFAEWPILYSVAKDKDGLLHKEMVRGVFDGTLFERLEEERAKKQK